MLTVHQRLGITALLVSLVAAVPCVGVADGGAPNPKGVAALVAAHDRALVKELTAYLNDNPKAEDLDQAYMTVLDKAIEHDWFLDNEPIAKRYLADRPEGPVRSMAQIVEVMARAEAEDFASALARFHELMAGLGKPEQEDFAAKFADSLASAAAGAGETTVARKVYQALIDRYGQSTALVQKVKDDLKRLDMVGSPAPGGTAKDLKGDPFRIDSLKGKYVLVDFWATWCAPCVAELPRLQAAFAKYHDKGFEIVGVSLDETKPAVVDFVKARKIPWRQIHHATSEGDMVDAFGVGTIPATFLIDPSGVVTRIELRGPALDKVLAKVFGGGDLKKAARAAR